MLFFRDIFCQNILPKFRVYVKNVALQNSAAGIFVTYVRAKKLRKMDVARSVRVTQVAPNHINI